MNCLSELSSRFEYRHAMSGHINGRTLRDVTSYSLFASMKGERTKLAQIHFFAFAHVILDTFHDGFGNNADRCFVISRCYSYFAYQFSFCHNTFYVYSFSQIGKIVQSYYKIMKYENFSSKKLQICDFFCNFAPKMENLYRQLYNWYAQNRRVLPWRETDDPYAIWLSEIILQQTRVAQGMDYYMRFLNRWPTVEALAAADEAEVLREWQGLGYYSRARNLHKAAKQITTFPRTFDELRALPGVGEYTAGAIASFAYNLPYPAMDGNVYRVVARLLDIDEAFDTSAGKKLFHKKIETLLDRDNPRLFNSAIMEFGALYCTPVLGDACATCPLQNMCMGYAHGTAEVLPVRKPRPKVRDRWFTYTIYTDGVYTLIQRRENPKDIWYHLYEFPCEEGQTEDKYPFTHVLSHQKLHARFIVRRIQKMPDIAGTIVIRWEDLNDYALSRLTLRALDTLRLIPQN